MYWSDSRGLERTVRTLAQHFFNVLEAITVLENMGQVEDLINRILYIVELVSQHLQPSSLYLITFLLCNRQHRGQSLT